MSKVFEIDFNRMLVLLLPTFLRKSKMTTWLKVLISPVVALHYNFMQERNRDLYKLTHNSQVCYLRKALNDEFDKDFRRIEITDVEGKEPNYIYTFGEKKPKFLGKIYLNNSAGIKGSGVDFYVRVPLKVANSKDEIRALVDLYRLASKRYEIIRI